MPDTLAHYTFVPWLRRGIAARIDEADHLGSKPNDGPLGRAGLAVELVIDYLPLSGGTVSALPTIARRVELLGPGDVLGIKAQVVARVEPLANTSNATPGELAFVEFYEEDFPWRYTPARAAAASEPAERLHKLRPWLALFVLRSDEFTVTPRDSGPAVLTVNPGVPLPPVDETWAWAHAQIGSQLDGPNAIDAAVAAAPDQALSRLMSPRKLEADNSYAAFIVPAFETGRLAGLNDADPGAPAQKPSWGAGAADRRFPIYFQWAFNTAGADSFETLARQLVPGEAGATFGKRTMDISDPGYGLPAVADATVEFEGALCPLHFKRIDYPDNQSAAFTTALQSLVDLSQDMQSARTADLPHPFASTDTMTSRFAPLLRSSAAAPDDPIVTPPAYGRMYTNVGRIADAAARADLAWLLELNLDVRSRAAAGLGTEIVRTMQDELMERAWRQVGSIEATNQRLREAELASAAGDALHSKHLSQMTDDRVLTLTAAAQRGLRAPQANASVRGVIADSRVPTAAQTTAFRRLARPQRRLIRQLTDNGSRPGIQEAILQRMNRDSPVALSTARPKVEPAAAVALALVSTTLTAALGAAVANPEAKTWFLELLNPVLAAEWASLGDPAALARIKKSASEALKAATGRSAQEIALAGRVGKLIDAIQTLAQDGPNAALVTITTEAFVLEFGKIAGKTYAGVTVRPQPVAIGGAVAAATDGEIARAASVADLKAYGSALGGFTGSFVEGRPLPAPAAALGPLKTLAGHVLDRLRPRSSIARSVSAGVEGLADTLASRDAQVSRPLRAVMAAPQFDDPMFEPLRRLSQDYILPNVTDLPKNSLTLMVPNTRFIESYMAGLNVEVARELLWREYPTDLRGTYLRSFWDTRDAVGQPARQDIKAIDQWAGALGAQSQTPTDVLVLVIRGDLLRKYPNTVVYAQEAEWIVNDPQHARTLKPDGLVKFPVFQADLVPDVAVFGFDLGSATALGDALHPGWFFVLKERPGQVRFGADDSAPQTGFETWDDLAWDHIPLADGTYVRIGAGAAAPQPTDGGGITWGASSAHQAFAMFQSPVMCARHAAEMLPSE